tara:strand:- start:857 stop:1897 length:1041 start_codon:yes stop_codon:yes gene_type:complete
MNNPDKIEIGVKYVGEGEPSYIVAEVGSNHNGDFQIAKELIGTAADAGADAIKFQVFSAEKHYSRNTPHHSGYNENLYNLIKKLEIPREWLADLKSYSDKKGILFFASPCDYEAVNQLEEIGVALHKIASFEIVDLELIRYVARKQKPLIVSTGLANMGEIEDAYRACLEVNNKNVIFLQCASSYPSSPDIMNLRAMETISKTFNVNTGLSDHTQDIHVSVASVAMGAKLIEKHFTLDKKMVGPDHSFATEPREFARMVKQIRDVESALGTGMKCGPSPSEMENFEKARRSIHAACDIPNGTEITKNMLITKRPGYGIRPKLIDIVIGRKSRIDIKEDRWITWEMV